MTQRTYTHTTGKPTTTKTKATKMEILGVVGLFVVMAVMLAVAIFSPENSSLRLFVAKWGIPFAVPTYLAFCGLYCALKGDKR